MMFKIAVYGSLKKGKYNHVMIKDSQFIGDDKIKGYMTLVYSYPQLLLTEDGDEHDIEVYLVDEPTYIRLHGMEIGAGYVEKRVDTKHGSCIMWVYEFKEDMSGHYITKY